MEANLLEALGYFEEVLQRLPGHLVSEDQEEVIKTKLKRTCQIIATNEEELHAIIRGIQFNP